MASNNECLIIILDVRHSADEDFKLKSVKCAAEILKDKICCGKKDYVSFVLVGTKNTENDLNAALGGHENIIQYTQTQITTWALLLNYFRFVNEEPNDDDNAGDWMEALVVAVNMLKEANDTFKFARQRILLFYDFNFMQNNYDKYEIITKKILQNDIDLIVGTHNIAYIDNTATGNDQAVFRKTRKPSGYELENQKYALRLVSNCNATLCNFKEVLNVAFKTQNKRPWTWSAKLKIGTKIEINVAGIIAIKDESNLKLKKVWGEANEVVTREVQYHIKGNEILPLPEDLIDGYMLGGTPIPYEKSSVEDKTNLSPGIKFIGFVKRDEIPDEYYCGTNLYLIVHQKGRDSSACKLDALVRAMLARNCVMLCWKIYSAKFNQPRLTVLIPNDLVEWRPATLSMLELAFNVQHHFWDFPALRTEKTACTEEQFQAIDKLIDSMDLECTLQDAQRPRDKRKNDLLPFDEMPHIYEQNLMDLLERKVLCQASTEEQFLAMLEDKNFVEAFWQIPEPIEEKAKAAANKLKKLFPLQNSNEWLKKLNAKKQEHTNTKSNLDTASMTPTTMLHFETVGLATPARDFEQLLKHNVLTLTNQTERCAKFNVYAAQMREVIFELLNHDKIVLDTNKMILAFSAYRERSLELNAFEDYNTFLEAVKDLVIKKNLQKFWEDVMLKHKLGICVMNDLTISLEDELRVDAFYAIREWQQQQRLESDIIIENKDVKDET